MAKERDEANKESSDSREQRMRRIQGLIQDRGKDAAKMIKTWLHKDQERRK